MKGNNDFSGSRQSNPNDDITNIYQALYISIINAIKKEICNKVYKYIDVLGSDVCSPIAPEAQFFEVSDVTKIYQNIHCMESGYPSNRFYAIARGNLIYMHRSIVDGPHCNINPGVTEKIYFDIDIDGIHINHRYNEVDRTYVSQRLDEYCKDANFISGFKNRTIN